MMNDFERARHRLRRLLAQAEYRNKWTQAYLALHLPTPEQQAAAFGPARLSEAVRTASLRSWRSGERLSDEEIAERVRRIVTGRGEQRHRPQIAAPHCNQVAGPERDEQSL